MCGRSPGRSGSRARPGRSARPPVPEPGTGRLRALPPGMSRASSTTTSNPRSASSCAAVSPATPPPRIATSRHVPTLYRRGVRVPAATCSCWAPSRRRCWSRSSRSPPPTAVHEPRRPVAHADRDARERARPVRRQPGAAACATARAASARRCRSGRRRRVARPRHDARRLPPARAPRAAPVRPGGEYPGRAWLVFTRLPFVLRPAARPVDRRARRPLPLDAPAPRSRRRPARPVDGGRHRRATSSRAACGSGDRRCTRRLCMLAGRRVHGDRAATAPS